MTRLGVAVYVTAVLSAPDLSFAFADLRCLLLVYKVLDDAVQVCIPPGQEQDVISSDGRPARMATKALQVYGNILYSSGQDLWLPRVCSSSGMLTDLSPDHLCQGTNELRCGIPIPSQGLFIDHFADCEPKCGFETLLIRVSE